MISLYYFSGTGNSLKVANELKEGLSDCEIIPIATAIKEEKPTTYSDKIGFVFPLYYYGLPKIVYDFVSKLEFGDTNYILAVITRAGDVDGVPLIQLERILNSKSKKLNAGFFIKMPDNFIIGTYDEPGEDENVLFENCGKDIQNILEFVKNDKTNQKIEIIEGKKYRYERGNLKFHKNVSAGDEYFYSDDNCTFCGVCAEVCPVDNIRLVEGKPEWQHKCQQCLACINYCPVNSIQYGKNTIGKVRYHHPEIKAKDIKIQK